MLFRVRFFSLCIVLCLAIPFTSSAMAGDIPASIKAGLPYDQARASLIADGWAPVVNAKILRSSLYAQEIFEHGYAEVVDCISMELDACTFRYSKNHRVIEIKTITRTLLVDRVSSLKK